jgi:hypothetical protein
MALSEDALEQTPRPLGRGGYRQRQNRPVRDIPHSYDLGVDSFNHRPPPGPPSPSWRGVMVPDPHQADVKRGPSWKARPRQPSRGVVARRSAAPVAPRRSPLSRRLGGTASTGGRLGGRTAETPFRSGKDADLPRLAPESRAVIHRDTGLRLPLMHHLVQQGVLHLGPGVVGWTYPMAAL